MRISIRLGTRTTANIPVPLHSIIQNKLHFVWKKYLNAGKEKQVQIYGYGEMCCPHFVPVRGSLHTVFDEKILKKVKSTFHCLLCRVYCRVFEQYLVHYRHECRCFPGIKCFFFAKAVASKKLIKVEISQISYHHLRIIEKMKIAQYFLLPYVQIIDLKYVGD